MTTTTVRISKNSLENLREIAKKAGKPMQEILDQAVEEYRRKQFLEESNKAFAKLKENRHAWQDEQREREVWEFTLGDGLEDDE